MAWLEMKNAHTYLTMLIITIFVPVQIKSFKHLVVFKIWYLVLGKELEREEII